ncbi:hypothetical protein [Curtobacterium sp. VKM Ac-1395]|uniref:hypothetical protein n=1 Tax=Curtobacterium sp. VKM Ac-1395 TaxID=2783815 RepID=UPI00188CD563|nr:hypothetical protein [Curtobacterium sp. VKM Ac-1395]MBF4592051.1 hypothetical protein [Curtobacterium sp. VKM Ac-1395]
MIPASDGTIFDGRDVGERAAIAAERALTISPELGYGLHDVIANDDALASALASPIAVRLLLQGTIDGVRSALVGEPRQKAVIEAVATVAVPPAPGGTLTDADMRRAHTWITGAMGRPVAAVGRHVDSTRGLLDYDTVADDPLRASAMMIALVSVADAILAAARAGGTPDVP